MCDPSIELVRGDGVLSFLPVTIDEKWDDPDGDAAKSHDIGDEVKLRDAISCYEEQECTTECWPDNPRK